jgi:hypothetical protein
VGAAATGVVEELTTGKDDTMIDFTTDTVMTVLAGINLYVGLTFDQPANTATAFFLALTIVVVLARRIVRAITNL